MALFSQSWHCRGWSGTGSRHKRAAEREVRYLHTFCSHSSVALGGGWGGGVSQDGGGPQELSVAFHTPTIGGAGEQATRVRTGVLGSLLLLAQTQA